MIGSPICVPLSGNLSITAPIGTPPDYFFRPLNPLTSSIIDYLCPSHCV
jgi:hypothetical protein